MESNIGSLIFLGLIALLFIPIVLNGRRQKRTMAEMQALQASLEPGDVVITTSGLRGTVVDASYEETVDIEIAEGVVTTWVRPAVREKVAADVVPEPADADADSESDADADSESDADASPRP